MNIITFLEITNIIKYIKYVNTIKNNLNIDFVNKFIEYADKDEHYIRQCCLDKYSFLSSNIITDCKDVITNFCKSIIIISQNYEEISHIEHYLFPNGINKDRMMNNYKYYLNPSVLKIFLEIFLLESYNSDIVIFRKYIDIVLLCNQEYDNYQKELYNYYPIYKEQMKENKITNLENKITNLENKVNYNIYDLL
jgi:hypothetical protein